ncbi:MAG: class I SAM-dependent methyltransferase [Acidobacteria bacterium]|nr:class I SAM-dependent methyltransferase [Acidobacteriota bacterium]
MDDLLEATSRAEARHFWFAGFRRFVRPLLAQAVAGRPRPLILDCGCGTGANLSLIGEFGAAYGFDLSQRGLAFASRSGHHRLARASIGAIPFPDASFDLVTSFDVIYALPETVEMAAVKEMHRVLRPGGALVLNVAAMEILRGDHSVLSKELRRYSRPHLKLVVERAGFEVVRLTHTNASLFPLMLAVRTIQRIAGLAPPKEAGIEIATPAAPVNAALKLLLALEAYALRWMNMPCGSSLLCLARKKTGVSGK